VLLFNHPRVFVVCYQSKADCYNIYWLFYILFTTSNSFNSFIFLWVWS